MAKKPRQFSDVYEAVFPTVFRVAYRISGERGIAEDLCHEAFVQYLQTGQDFDDLDQARYWLIRVVRNISLNHEKRRSRERAAYNRYRSQSPEPASEDGLEQQLLRDETRGRIQEALNQLPYNLRTTLVLSVYARLNYRQIATILKTSEGNVKVRMYRARTRLAQLLQESASRVS